MQTIDTWGGAHGQHLGKRLWLQNRRRLLGHTFFFFFSDGQPEERNPRQPAQTPIADPSMILNEK
jgi:hypothetical protein